MSRPASWAACLAAQARMELRLTARRGENLLAMVGIPLAVLLFTGAFASRGSTPALPAVLATALVASGMVNLGIATAYERGYGVLKRVGGSPLGRSGLVAAKVGVVLMIGLVQVVAVLGLAGAMGGEPEAGTWSWAALLLSTLVGAGAFAALGLLLAGTLRPEAALVLINVLFLVAIGLGLAAPTGVMPDPLGQVLAVLPTLALARSFEVALGATGDLWAPLAVVAAWGLAFGAAAARTFRWD